MATGHKVNPDLGFIREIKEAGGGSLKKCYQCATCSVVCNLSPADNPFPRKEMILAGWGQADRLMSDPDVWLCYQCNDCSTHCPRGAKPGDVLAAIRAYAYKKFAFPSFMGKALANPKMLPFLILVPALILYACIQMFAPRTEAGQFLYGAGAPIDFNIFLPHSTVDALFVIGNILIFCFAAIGFWRFWKMLQSGGAPKKEPFWRSLFITLKEVLNHEAFFECETNQYRGQAHILLLVGFAGAMITTGLVFVFIFIPHYLKLLGLEQFRSLFELPLSLPHPVKILGAASGTLMTLGGAILIFRRWGKKADVGANGYADHLFLYVIFIVGVTGMFSWIFRALDSAFLAYLTYYVHLVSVWFLLWYMPYSKFAHMIYRTLALVHARMIGRSSCKTKHEIWDSQGFHLLAGTTDKSSVWS